MAATLDAVQPRTRRLRRADPSRPGFSRRKRGKGFGYLDQRGRRIDDETTLERIRSLAIRRRGPTCGSRPTTWGTSRRSAPTPRAVASTGTTTCGGNGATVRSTSGWRRSRGALPEFRARRRRGSGEARAPPRSGCSRARRGSWTKRSSAWAARATPRQNGSFGLATIRRDHVHVRGAQLTFDYTAKGGIRRIQRRRRRRAGQGREGAEAARGRRARSSSRGRTAEAGETSVPATSTTT